MDPFAHLPHLHGKLTPADESALRVTLDMLAEWDERARLLGRPGDWRLSNQALEASRRAVVGALDEQQDFWVFSYGSLMWDPGFHFVEVRLAELPSHQRRFTFKTDMGRGSPQCPGLMLSLAPAEGSCQGLAFRIAAQAADAETAIIWRREMVRGSYSPKRLPVSTPQGDVEALVFADNPGFRDHVGELPIDQTAAIIAQASGMLGTNREYLEQLALQLGRLEIEDAYLSNLLQRVQAIAAD